MGSCRECSGRHNTLCHLPLNMKEKPTKESVETPSMSNANNENNDQVAIHLSANALAKHHVIIATARVYAILPNGSNVPCRILLDSVSEAHLVTSSACNKIGVRRNQSSEIITGVNELTNQIHQNTKLGWVLAGPIMLKTNSKTSDMLVTTTSLHCSTQQGESLNRNLERFWEIENCNTYVRPIMSKTEQKCEEIFELTTVRDNNGRFVVRLPIREDAEPLGESRGIAENRLRQLERRFKSNPSLREEYNKFMREYETLGHMSQVRDDEDRPNSQTVYLPHHCVVKESSSTTQYRAVFDASSKTTSGRSLNDILMIDPTIQNSLIEIMIRFRMHKIALTGDIKKMYRQVIIDPQDRDYQRILWRYSLDEPIREYRLNTVTYGEASSSYLAIKCICKLAEIGEHAYPNASRVLRDETYVDDIMTGAEDVKGAIELRAQISELLSTGGFEAHKWHSNSPEVVSLTPQNEKMSFILSIDDKTAIKALGLEWNPDENNFKFTVHKLASSITKRQVLSAIKLLSTGGFEAHKWHSNSPEVVSLTPQNEKMSFILSIDDKTAIKALGLEWNPDEDNFKFTVPPIKTTTLPRLELCSAVLLTRLVTVVLRALKIPIKNVRMWSDSMVVLYWIRGDVSRWKSFVANRVTEINETIPAVTWGHVSGKENPADVLSRGTSPRLLEELQSWWVGPPWLLDKGVLTENQREFDLSPDACKLIFIEERKKGQTCHVATGGQQLIANLLNTFSSVTKIERVIAYYRRFILNAKRKPQDHILSSLSMQELCEARRVLIRYVQANHFAREFSDLKSNRNSKSSSKIASLMPFLDNQDIIRVGGRLQQKVDFAGPIITLVNKGRGRKTNKSYITLFVCFATKAIHLEVTSELSTAAFMATLRRFVSRRGCPHTIWSDNGTNFVGANRELTEIQQFIRSQVVDEAGDMLTNEGINWRFLPPNSPHMGSWNKIMQISSQTSNGKRNVHL
ncbi:uncharacterized protein LOC116844765 [Odontomachus brunneus]|uniref:uncharacterized protein LOC116844765 n=1 Tax=Odontomachus brunneus TaxID=486640 RepID=UPI0013F26D50|nr:uncharacterized protein LOC116844765 [Odontomachus brunneus]